MRRANRRLHIKPLKRLSPNQFSLLDDAAMGALKSTQRGWRRVGGGDRHARNTADSLIKRRLLALEFGLLIITPKGRAFLIEQEAAARAAA